MAYYNSDGTVYGGDVHTMADGRIMTGASHDSGSVQVFVTNPKDEGSNKRNHQGQTSKYNGTTR